ncbi:MAG: ABC transporter permease [Planctomycetota bacterium]|nr:MAG: ABC transporter permease [Planctomycetota bacterium]
MILTILRIMFLRLRNNPLELVLVFVMPVVFFSIFAGIFSKGIASGSDKKLRVGWIAAHETALSLELRAFLEKNSTLQCSSLIARQSLADLDDEAEEKSIAEIEIEATIAEAQRSGRYDLIIRLPKDFPSQLADSHDSTPCAVLLVTDGQNPMAVAMVTSVVRGFFAQKNAAAVAEQLVSLSLAAQSSSGYGGARETGGARYFDPVKDPSQVFGNDPDSRFIVTNLDGVNSVNGVSDVPKEWAIAPPKAELTTEELLKTALADKPESENDEAVSISVENPQAATQENPRIAMYAAGIAVLFLLFSSTGNAAALLEEAESGTLDRILVSQAGLFHIVTGKWLGILLLGCLQITVMFVWAEIVFRIQLGEHIVGFCIMTFSTAAATASFAMLLATLCKSRAQLNAVSVVIILSMSAVGGSMIPRFAMSDRMKEIGRWTFNAWALDGYQKVFWFQSPLTSLQNEVAVLLGSSFVLGVLTLLFSGRWKRG